MSNSKSIIIYKTILLTFLIFALIFLNSKTVTNIIHAQVQEINNYKLKYRTKPSKLLDDKAIKAIEESFNQSRFTAAKSNFITAVGILRSGTNWEILSMTTLDMDSPLSYSLYENETLPRFDESNTFNVLYIKKSNETFVAIDSDPKVAGLLDLIPNSELSKESKKVFLTKVSRERQIALSYNSWKLPWQSGEAWHLSAPTYYKCYWHNNAGKDCLGTGLDLIPPDPRVSRKVITPIDGSVTFICLDPDDDNALMTFTRSGTSQSMQLVHFAETSVPQGLENLSQGAYLGTLTSDTEFPTWECGSSTGPHLHINFMNKPQSIDGYYFANPIGSSDPNKPPNDINVMDYKTIIYSSNVLLTHECTSPISGDWLIPNPHNCSISNRVSIDGNITIESGASLSIRPTGSLDFDFQNKRITIENGGKLLIENGGKVY